MCLSLPNEFTTPLYSAIFVFNYSIHNYEWVLPIERTFIVSSGIICFCRVTMSLQIVQIHNLFHIIWKNNISTSSNIPRISLLRRQTKDLKVDFNTILILPMFNLYFSFRGYRYAFDQFVLWYIAVTVSSHYVQIWKEKSFKF